jgi:putative ABC transport system permease protein
LDTDIIGETLNLNVIQSVPEGETEAKNIPATIIGVVEDDSPPVIYLKIGSVRDYTEDEYSALSIIINKESSLDFVRKQIESLGLETFSIMDTVNQVQQIFTYVRYSLLAFGILAFAIAFLGMINTLTVSLLERTREVGLMKIYRDEKEGYTVSFYYRVYVYRFIRRNFWDTDGNTRRIYSITRCISFVFISWS